MTPERWKQVDRVLQAAMDQPAGELDEFLRNACAGDLALEREVRQLLDHEKNAGSFLRRPAMDVAAQALAEQSQTAHTDPRVGSTISHFRILEVLGGGGMGLVYKALDTRLERPVALKFLSDTILHNEEAVGRFRREARAASSLNHPNICTLYDIGEHDGRPFLVMEYLDGSTLKEHIAAAPLSIGTVLEIGIEIAGGLDAAHRAGIIHRDIKPANFFITGRGTAKILDFGLAKMVGAGAAATDSQSTFSGPGAVMGTFDYMSPEQLRGEPLDPRTDIFSFGLVLYEMATGIRPTVAIQPGAELPPGLGPVVSKCLQADRERRYQHASEIAADLERLRQKQDAPPVLPARRSHYRLAAMIGALVTLVAILALAAWWYFRMRLSPHLTEKDTIVLADFANKTGDPVFDDTLRQGLAVQLEQSPFLSLVPDERIQGILRMMNRPADQRLTPDVAKEVCERSGGAAVLEGSIASLGSQYVLGLRAKNCRTGDVIDDQQMQAAKKEDVLTVLGRIASRFRTRAGESLASVKQLETPLVEATTPSLEALKLYSAAWKLGLSPDPSAAEPLLQRAIEIDPQFAMAYAFLGRIYGDTWESKRAAESIIKAYRLRNRTSERERFFIAMSYDLQVTGNLDKARRTGLEWAQTYPRARDAHGLLSVIYQQSGDYQKSIEFCERSLQADPNFPPGYVNLAWAYTFLNRYPDAQRTIRQALDHKFGVPDLVLLPYYIGFLRSDQAAMDRQAAIAKTSPGAEDWTTNAQAFVAAYSGHLQSARSFTRQAAGLAQKSGQKERAAMFYAGAAIREAFFGNAREAIQNAEAARALSDARDVEYGVAFALALSGDRSPSRALTNDLDKRYPEDTFVRFTYLPVLRAFDSLDRSDATAALELLQPSSPYELGIPGSWFGFFGNLYPAYSRGLAYLTAHRSAEAAAEFQKIINHAALVWSDPVAIAARVSLARAWSLAGDTEKARSAYRDFLALWKDADTDIPLLKNARAEYAKLQ